MEKKKKKYLINTYKGVAGAYEASEAIRLYADYIGAEIIYKERKASKGAEIIYMDGFNDIYCNEGLWRSICNHRAYRIGNEFVRKAFENAKKIIVGKNKDGSDKTYLDSMLEQRLEGPTNAGSSYRYNSKEELYEELINSDWKEVSHPDVMEGCRVFMSNLPGLEGILDIYFLPDDVELYAIDPKNTGKVGIGTGKVTKDTAYETYLITGKEKIDGKDVDVVFTFHPGEPVKPSEVETKDIPDGTKLSKEEAMKLGFNRAKYLSEELLEQYRQRNKRKEQLTGIEEQISDRKTEDVSNAVKQIENMAKQKDRKKSSKNKSIRGE